MQVMQCNKWVYKAWTEAGVIIECNLVHSLRQYNVLSDLRIPLTLKGLINYIDQFLYKGLVHNPQQQNKQRRNITNQLYKFEKITFHSCFRALVHMPRSTLTCW